MEVLTIIPGGYSVKFQILDIDKKSFEILKSEEILLSSFTDDLSEDAAIEETQSFIISSFLKKNKFDGKMISVLPHQQLASRFMELPGTNRKKINAMIPFQLEESIPFAMQDTIYCTSLKKKNDTTWALIDMAPREQFINHYQNLKSHHILPAILTSELSIISNFVDSIDRLSPYCLLDVGHEGTKAYFVNKKHVISSHYSNIAGKILNEVIATSYQISIDEAQEYKHQNSFFLTENQYTEVGKDQHEFALLMKSTFQSLINDFKRWDIGFRANFGSKVGKIYLFGGSSKINNIENFLTQQLGIETVFLDLPIQHPRYFKEGTELARKDNHFSINLMIGFSQLKQKLFTNFLQGEFSSNFSTNIPFQATSFVFIRVAMISFILSSGLLIERVTYLNRYSKTLSKKVKVLIKKPDLQLNKRVKPKTALRKLILKNKELDNQLKNINSLSDRNAVSALLSLGKYLNSNKLIDLIKYSSDGNESTAIFVSKNIAELIKMKNQLAKQKLKINDLSLDKKTKKLTLSFGKGL